MNFINLIDILETNILKDPNGIAYTYLIDGESKEENITWSELAVRIKQAAAGLQAKAKKGDRVILAFLPGIEFIIGFFACMYAGVIAVPTYPPFNQEQALKLDGIIEDAEPSLYLTSESILNKIKLLKTFSSFSFLKKLSALVNKNFSNQANFATNEWLTLNDINRNAELWNHPQPEANDIVFLQYTSGSTGNPKGVMISQINLVTNLNSIQQDFGLTEASKVVFWLPPYHDMGLIGGLITSAYCHYQNIFMSPMAFIQKPIRWLKAMSKYQATTSGAPNFAYELCVTKISDSEKIGLDLSSWELAFNGSDTIHANTLKNFVNAFSPYGFKESSFFPCYGLAEATLYVSGAPKNQGPTTQELALNSLLTNKIAPEVTTNDSKLMVSSGRVAPNVDVKIVNPDTLLPCNDNEVGEIWIAGDNVSSGYWQKEALNKEVFQHKLPFNDKNYFRTGDLGLMSNGEIFNVGRIKELIIIRGRKFHPEDVEKSVETSHPNIRRNHSVAFGIMRNDLEELVVVSEILAPDNNEDIANKINFAVIEKLGIPVDHIILVAKKTIKKTTSGKLRRIYTRNQYLENKLAPLHVWHNELDN